MNDKNITLERFKQLVTQSKKPREAIANAIGCDTSTITKHFNGDRNISTEYIIKYAKYFNVSSDFLLGLTDTPVTDKDKQYISDYTGLQDFIIDKLHNHSTNNNDYMRIVNLFMYFDCFDTLIEYIELYLNSVADYEKFVQQSKSDLKTSHTSADDIAIKEKLLKQKISLSNFEITQNFNYLISHVIKPFDNDYIKNIKSEFDNAFQEYLELNNN